MPTGWSEGSTDDTGLGLPFTYFTNWAYLNSVGLYDAATQSRFTFPIVVGEFGIVFNSSFNASEHDFSDPLVSISEPMCLQYLPVSEFTAACFSLFGKGLHSKVFVVQKLLGEVVF